MAAARRDLRRASASAGSSSASGSLLLIARPRSRAMIGVADRLPGPGRRRRAWRCGHVGPRAGSRADRRARASSCCARSLVNSHALLAFFALSNARRRRRPRCVFDDHDAGLYAGGLILTKARAVPAAVRRGGRLPVDGLGRGTARRALPRRAWSRSSRIGTVGHARRAGCCASSRSSSSAARPTPRSIRPARLFALLGTCWR